MRPRWWWLVFATIVTLTGLVGAVAIDRLLGASVRLAWHFYGDSMFVLGNELLFVSRPEYWIPAQPAQRGRMEVLACVKGTLLGGNQGGVFLMQHARRNNLREDASCESAVGELGISLDFESLETTGSRDVVFGQEMDVVVFSGKTRANKTFFGQAVCYRHPTQLPRDGSTWILWSISPTESHGLLRRATTPRLWDLIDLFRQWRRHPSLIVF